MKPFFFSAGIFFAKKNKKEGYIFFCFMKKNINKRIHNTRVKRAVGNYTVVSTILLATPQLKELSLWSVFARYIIIFICVCKKKYLKKFIKADNLLYAAYALRDASS